MNELESALLTELTAGSEPELLLRTNTRIDCGRWWRKTPVWLCITKTELILFAIARRRYSERIPLADCHASQYAPSGGELMIKPTESLRIRHLILTTRQAIQALQHFNR